MPIISVHLNTATTPLFCCGVVSETCNRIIGRDFKLRYACYKTEFTQNQFLFKSRLTTRKWFTDWPPSTDWLIQRLVAVTIGDTGGGVSRWAAGGDGLFVRLCDSVSLLLPLWDRVWCRLEEETIENLCICPLSMIIVFCCHFCDFSDFWKFAFFWKICICICKFAILQSLCFLQICNSAIFVFFACWRSGSWWCWCLRTAWAETSPRSGRPFLKFLWNPVFFCRTFIFFFYPVDDGVHAAVEDGGEVEDVLHNHWNLNDRTFSYMLKFKY